jgi:hypothetical protein
MCPVDAVARARSMRHSPAERDKNICWRLARVGVGLYLLETRRIISLVVILNMLIALIGTDALSLERSVRHIDRARHIATSSREGGGASIVAPQNPICAIDAATLPTPVIADTLHLHPIVFVSLVLPLIRRLPLHSSPRYRIGPAPPFLAAALQETYLHIALLLN